jgi:exodeoxyribonuclease III
MMRIITCNTNGIRSARQKGFFAWLEKQDADVVCIQETKAHVTQLDEAIFHPEGYHAYYFDAQKKGYSGTAIYSKIEPKKIIKGLGFPLSDDEGRWIQADFEHVSVVSLYMPSGSSGEERQQCKFEMMEKLLPHFQAMQKSGRQFIICSDWNICHKEIDLKNWKGNVKNSGFLPEERQWMDDLLNKEGFTDVFRELHPHAPLYTWWSNRGQAYAKDVGWRLDYQLVTSGLKGKAVRAEIYKEQKFSDHAPLIIDYDFTL